MILISEPWFRVCRRDGGAWRDVYRSRDRGEAIVHAQDLVRGCGDAVRVVETFETRLVVFEHDPAPVTEVLP